MASAERRVVEAKKTITKKELRDIFPRVELLYNYLEDREGLYLPYFKNTKNRDQSITVDYLYDTVID